MPCAWGGVSYPHFGRLEALGKKLAGPEPDLSHVDLAMSQLILSFEDDSLPKPRFLILPVSTTRDFTSEDSEPSQDFVSRFQLLLRLAPSHRELLLVPVHSEGHFTLLAVSGDTVRYYDGLHNPKEGCTKAAGKLCAAMGVSMPESRAHACRQIGAECAMFIVMMAERELRKLHNEPESLGGGPTVST